VVLFDDADEISVVAANILLKSLEEPRPDTYYILVAANSSRLPATVISRCQRWYFDRLTPLEMRKILDLKGDEYVDVNLDLLFAEGCFSSIEMMQTHPDMWDEVNEAISRAFEGDIARYQHALSTWVTKKDELPARLTLLLAAVQKKLTESVHTPSAAAVWSHAVQNVLDARYLILDRHVNPLLVCSSIMARMSRDLGVRYMSHPNTFETVWEEISRR
jgi:DNA polymerase III delta prime subunit